MTYLHGRGADINATDQYGRTALMLAARWYNYVDCVRCLHEKGADITATDKNGDTALMFAIGGYAADCITYLVEHGANIHVKNGEGKTALQHAKDLNNLDGVKILEEFVMKTENNAS